MVHKEWVKGEGATRAYRILEVLQEDVLLSVLRWRSCTTISVAKDVDDVPIPAPMAALLQRRCPLTAVGFRRFLC